MDSKRILEALNAKALTEDEKHRRGILRRLAGPIATGIEPTRNGRLYNEELWNKTLADKVFQEKIKNKSMLCELEHPEDGRETVDPLRACAAIPMMPKMIDGDLYAVIDVIDTPAGNILNKLIDYGYVPGISSRGTGDVLDDNTVDPDSFFLATWDIVGVPAVEKARLAICESYDPKADRLKKALNEAYSAASKEDKLIMKETLDRLNIQVENTADIDEAINVTEAVDAIDIAKYPHLAKYFEAGMLSTGEAAGTDGELITEDVDAEAVVAEEETVEETTPEAVETEEADADIEEALITVKDLHNALDAYDDETPVNLGQVTINDTLYDVEVSLDGNSDLVTLGVNCIPVEGYNENKATFELPEEENPELAVEIIADADDKTLEADETEPAAEDNGEEDVFESLKESIRQKNLLENEVKALKKAQAVSNAEAEALKRDLENYKSGFVRVSELASQATKAKKEVASLTEQLAQNKLQVEALNVKLAEKTSLTESMNTQTAAIESLKEQLAQTKSTAAATQKTLTGELEQYKQKFVERTNLAKNYKTKFVESISRYIALNAKMLGVSTAEITSRLDESYTLDDIDTVCETLLTSARTSRVPFGVGRTKAKAVINESAQPKQYIEDAEDAEGWDALLQLAGLKK